jgi:coenzyme PQQ synthesis protein D (PqqD)
MVEIDPEFVELGNSVIYHTLDQEVVLLNMATQQYYGLDSVGADMWNTLLEHRSLGTAAARIQESYEVDPETARADLHSLVRQLVAAGLLKSAEA